MCIYIYVYLGYIGIIDKKTEATMCIVDGSN